MKKIFVVLILSISILNIKAQYFYDFNESSSLYNEANLLKSLGISKEVLVVGVQKNDAFNDSIKLFVYNVNEQGKVASILFGSKWNIPVLRNSFVYTPDGNKTIIPFSQLEKDANSTDETIKTLAPSQPIYITYRYDYDSATRIKKIFIKRKGYPEMLLRLVYYNDQNHVTKIDLAPQSEAINIKEYTYKKNKIKICHTTSAKTDCADEMIRLNSNGQVSNYEITLGFYPKIVTYDYEYYYNDMGLVSLEVKKLNGNLVSRVAHHYYK